MADGVDFSIIGLDALQGKLLSISDDLRRRGGRAALRRAGNVIVDKAKENTSRIDDPATGRSIAANVAMRWNGRLFRTTGDLGFRIGVQHGAVLKKHPDLSENAPTPHWRLIEFGTERVRAQPFMRPAAETSTDEVVNVFATEYEKSIDRAILRAQKKGMAP